MHILRGFPTPKIIFLSLPAFSYCRCCPSKFLAYNVLFRPFILRTPGNSSFDLLNYLFKFKSDFLIFSELLQLKMKRYKAKKYI